MPNRLRTVSLLPSFALSSPKSPLPTTGVAKCNERADFEPPATTPHKALKAALVQSTIIINTDDPDDSHGIKNGISTELNRGRSESRVIAKSFNMSASKRYIFASGNSDVPR